MEYRKKIFIFFCFKIQFQYLLIGFVIIKIPQNHFVGFFVDHVGDGDVGFFVHLGAADGDSFVDHVGDGDVGFFVGHDGDGNVGFFVVFVEDPDSSDDDDPLFDHDVVGLFVDHDDDDDESKLLSSDDDVGFFVDQVGDGDGVLFVDHVGDGDVGFFVGHVGDGDVGEGDNMGSDVVGLLVLVGESDVDAVGSLVGVSVVSKSGLIGISTGIHASASILDFTPYFPFGTYSKCKYELSALVPITSPTFTSSFSLAMHVSRCL